MTLCLQIYLFLIFSLQLEAVEQELFRHAASEEVEVMYGGDYFHGDNAVTKEEE